MSLLTGFNTSLDEVGLLGQASQAAFVGGIIPPGWTVLTPAQLGLGSQYTDGIYFTDPTSGALAPSYCSRAPITLWPSAALTV
jgi:hypothetical protein